MWLKYVTAVVAFEWTVIAPKYKQKYLKNRSVNLKHWTAIFSNMQKCTRFLILTWKSSFVEMSNCSRRIETFCCVSHSKKTIVTQHSKLPMQCIVRLQGETELVCIPVNDVSWFWTRAHARGQTAVERQRWNRTPKFVHELLLTSMCFQIVKSFRSCIHCYSSIVVIAALLRDVNRSIIRKIKFTVMRQSYYA